MHTIGVIGKISRERFRVVHRIQSQSNIQIDIYSSFQEVQSRLSDGRVSGIVMVEKNFEDIHIEKMDEIICITPQLRFLCLVAQMRPSQRVELNRYQIPKSTVLDYNYELRDIAGVLQRLTSGEQVPVRRHFRYPVSKRASLISKAGPAHKIQIVDLSTGGLQAKCLSGIVHLGEKVQINVPMCNTKGKHLIVGNVAWMNKNGYIGIEFDQVLSQQNVVENKRVA